jgi:thymidine phosphorylase
MAKKSKGFGEILKQQRADKTHQKGLEELQRQVQKGPLGEKFAGMVMNPKGEVKRSEALETSARCLEVTIT